MSENSSLGIGTAIVIAVVLVGFGMVITSRAPSAKLAATPAANLVSMEQSGQAMRTAGQTMQAHGQTMLDEAKRTGDEQLRAHGEHWLSDGQQLAQGGEWMAQDPTAASSLQSSRSSLQQQGSWNELNRRAQAMLHDPTRAGSVDLASLQANGEAMQAEARNMTDHGRVMAEEADVMVERHKLQGQAAADLRGAAQTMRDVGGLLAQNGQEMVDYAGRLRRSLGLP